MNTEQDEATLPTRLTTSIDRLDTDSEADSDSEQEDDTT